jgi:hypothetical protein
MTGGIVISNCRFCSCMRYWVTNSRGHRRDKIDEISYAWESEYSNDWEPWHEEPDWDRLTTAGVIAKNDRKAAFHIYLELAEIGSVHSMNQVAWEYAFGKGNIVETDDKLADDWYYRAIEGGSWMATRFYAQFHQSRGNFAYSEEVLETGIEQRWVPAYFWLARYRMKHATSLNIFQEIRPLLEYAADKGHPKANAVYSKLMSFGIFGIREIPCGFKRRFAFCASLAAAAKGDVTAPETPDYPAATPSAAS